MIGEHEHRAEIGAEMLLPRGQAAEVVARRPVLPVLVVLVAGRKAATLHVDQPRSMTGRRDDEVETLKRATGHETATRFVDSNVRQPASAKKGFERGFVMIVAVHAWKL